MLRRIIQVMHHRRGQSTVEFALVLPVLTLILLGILDFGQIIYHKQITTEAAREGARAAAVSGDYSKAAPAAKKYDAGFVVAVNPAGKIAAGDQITVTVSTNITVDPLIGALLPSNPLTVTGTATMRAEVSTGQT